MEVDCTAVREDIEAYALGALAPADAREVRAHIEECSECARLVRDYGLAADHVALGVPLYRAPRRLKAEIMAATVPRERRRWAGGLVSGSPLWAGAVAAAVMLALGAIVWAVLMSMQVSDLRNENRLAQQRLSDELAASRSDQQQLSARIDQQSQLLDLAFDPDAIRTEMQGTSLASGARCQYVWSTYESVGALNCQDLPRPMAKQYQMWVTKGDTAVPVGDFVPESDGTASALVKLPANAPGGTISRMWVTLEPANSRPSTPGSDVVLVRATQ